MRLVRQQIRLLGPVDTTVVIEGETGTGKELVARAIHEASQRRHRPFIPLGIAGLAELLGTRRWLEYAPGVFSGAAADDGRLFDQVRGGTLLLDELGDMPANMQTHLLRVLRERESLRLGESTRWPSDVRVLATTHRNLSQEVAAGRFREDLLYRLWGARIILPPLRRRRDDIPLLAAAFLGRAAVKHRKAVDLIGSEAMARLLAHRWPGNVRELESTIELAVVRATARTIGVADLLPELAGDTVPPPRPPMSELERQRVLDTLKQTGGNRSLAARLLGMSRATLYRRLAAMGNENNR